MIENEQQQRVSDVSVRHVKRKDENYQNAEYAFDLPNVDKVAAIGLTIVEVTAIIVQPEVWTITLHLATIAAIAGLGGYSMSANRQKE